MTHSPRCDHCSGSGWIPYQIGLDTVCPRCHGAGFTDRAELLEAARLYRLAATEHSCPHPWKYVERADGILAKLGIDIGDMS